MGGDRSRPRGAERLQQRIARAAGENRAGPAEPDVRLGIHPLGAQPVVHLLRAHVEPVDDDVGVEVLEAMLEQREQVAAVGRIDDEGSAAVAPAGPGERDDQRGAENAERGTRNAEPMGGLLFRVPTSAFRVCLTAHWAP